MIAFIGQDIKYCAIFKSNSMKFLKSQERSRPLCLSLNQEIGSCLKYAFTINHRATATFQSRKLSALFLKVDPK